MHKDNQDPKDNKEHKNSQNAEVMEQILSASSVTDKSTVARSRNKSIYVELLDRLKKEFYTRWEKKSISSARGLDEFIPIKTLGTGSFGRVRSHSHISYNEKLDRLKKEFLQRWQNNTVSGQKGLQDFVHVKTIGTGAFGRVLLVKRKENDVDAYHAMKVIDKTKIMLLKQLDHTYYEKKILEAVRFPFIVNMEYCFKDNSYIYFVMPFINGGEMFTHLRRMRRFTEILSKFYAAQVVLSLEFLHYCDILYRDLKPENILIDQKGYIKIADLGFCKIVKGRTWTLCGTPEYIAPEIILSKGYGQAVDWWAFGVLLYEMNAGFPPFSSSDPMRIYEKIASGKYKIPKVFTLDLQDIIRNLLQTDLTRRYGNLKNGVRDIKDHKWFKDIDWIAIYNRQIVPPFIPAVKMVNDTSNFNAFPEEKIKVVTGRTWTLCGTPEYLAPEIILGRCYGKAVDWWTVGILVYEMNAGYPPFRCRDPLGLFEKILACKYKFPNIFSVELQDLLTNLLQVDLSRRYGNLQHGVMDIKNHKWFKTIDWVAIYQRQIEAPFIPTLKSSHDTSHFNSYKEEKLKISKTELYPDEFAMF